MSVLERMERQAVILERKRMFEDVDSRVLDLDWLMEFEQLQWRDKTRAMRYAGDPMASFVTGTNVECLYASVAAGLSSNTFTAEVNQNTTGTMGVGAKLGADFFTAEPGQIGRGIKIVAQWVISATGTPTYTFTMRMGSTQGAVTGTIVCGSGAMTAVSGVTTKGALADGHMILTAIGAAGANSTIRGYGSVSGAAFTSTGDFWGGAASPGTVATFDTSATNYINANVACSASSASNIAQLIALVIYGIN